jgi:hypothetical protein
MNTREMSYVWWEAKKRTGIYISRVPECRREAGDKKSKKQQMESLERK